MSVKIINHQSYFDGIRIALSQHFLDLQRPILSCSTFAERYMPSARKWFHFHEDLGDPFSDVLIVHTRRLSRRTWDRVSHLTDHLFTRFIHTYYRIIRVVRQVIKFENILHGHYECHIFLWTDFLLPASVRLKFIFFIILFSDMWNTDSVNFNSTALSAGSLTVHRRYPSGVSEQANAINLASKAPSSLTSRSGFSRGLRSKAASSPSSTNLFFRCSSARLLIPSASATSATFQLGPPGPASQSSKARARRNRLAWIFPRCLRVSSSLISYSESVTRYLGAMAISIIALPPWSHIYLTCEI